MLEKDSYIKSSTDKELAHADVALKNLGSLSVHQVILIQRLDQSLYTVWNTTTAGTAFTNFSNEKYLEAYSKLASELAEFGGSHLPRLTADHLRKLDAIYVLDHKPRIFNSLAELNDETVSEVKVIYKDF